MCVNTIRLIGFAELKVRRRGKEVCGYYILALFLSYVDSIRGGASLGRVS